MLWLLSGRCLRHPQETIDELWTAVFKAMPPPSGEMLQQQRGSVTLEQFCAAVWLSGVVRLGMAPSLLVLEDLAEGNLVVIVVLGLVVVVAAAAAAIVVWLIDASVQLYGKFCKSYLYDAIEDQHVFALLCTLLGKLELRAVASCLLGQLNPEDYKTLHKLNKYAATELPYDELLIGPNIAKVKELCPGSHE